MTKKPKNNKNVINMGCRLNIYEGGIIKKILKDNKNEDIIVVNTCAVTSEAERQSRQAVRKAANQNPEKMIIVTGCAAQINPSQFKNIPQVIKILGNNQKFNTEFYQNTSCENCTSCELNQEKIIVSDIQEINETASHMTPIFNERSRAFLQIQNGCNYRCSYCIIPLARGISRSIPSNQIIKNILTLENDYNEFVLTGVDITDYGNGLNENINLGKLCKKILKETKIPRLRLSSLDVAKIDKDLFDLIKNEPRFMPYFHISIQSGDNYVLEKMKRRHTRENVMEFCQIVKNFRPEVGFGADFICGFPSENEEMFENTINLVNSIKIPYIHAFTYSQRTGTIAAKMKQVPLKIRKERTNRLILEGNKIHKEFLFGLIGSKQKIVLENGNQGVAENFAKIKINRSSDKYKIGSIVEVICHSINEDLSINGELIN